MEHPSPGAALVECEQILGRAIGLHTALRIAAPGTKARMRGYVPRRSRGLPRPHGESMDWLHMTVELGRFIEALRVGIGADRERRRRRCGFGQELERTADPYHLERIAAATRALLAKAKP